MASVGTVVNIKTRQELDDLIRSSTALPPPIEQLTEYAPGPAVYLKVGGVPAFYDSPEDSQKTTTEALTPADRELLALFRALERKAKALATNPDYLFRDSAVRLTQLLSVSGQLGGWKRVETFMIQHTIQHTRVGTSMKSQLDPFLESSEKMLRDTMTRAKWVLELEKGSADDGRILHRILGVLLKDSTWMDEGMTFLRTAEKEVSAVINSNPPLFAHYREHQQGPNIQWPHSPGLRLAIEQAGFCFRPMMVKIDRCVCDNCGVEVSGWRPWQSPWLMHNWAKPHPSVSPPPEILAYYKQEAELAKIDQDYCNNVNR